MFKKYVHKPVAVEAIQATLENEDALVAIANAFDITMSRNNVGFIIHGTLESTGPIELVFGDWILKTPEGLVYPCTNEIFQKNFEEAVEHNAADDKEGV